MSHLIKGNLASNFEYLCAFDKTSKSYFEECQNKKSVIYFLRYVGCLVCQLDIKRINDSIASFRNKNVEIFVVIQSSIESIEAYNSVQKINFRFVSDSSSQIYKRYLVTKGNIFQFLHPNSIPKVFKSLKSGFRHGKFEGEETQLPAVFIVNENHIINYSYYGSYISDLPTIDEILQKI